MSDRLLKVSGSLGGTEMVYLVLEGKDKDVLLSKAKKYLCNQGVPGDGGAGQSFANLNKLFATTKSDSLNYQDTKKLSKGPFFHKKPIFKNPVFLMHPGEEVSDPSEDTGCSQISTPTNVIIENAEADPNADNRILRVIRHEDEPFLGESPLEKFDRLVNKQFRMESLQTLDLKLYKQDSFSMESGAQANLKVDREKITQSSKNDYPYAENLVSSYPSIKSANTFNDYWKNYHEQRNRVIVPILKKNGKHSVSPDRENGPHLLGDKSKRVGFSSNVETDNLYEKIK
jgi:hypothetical protein